MEETKLHWIDLSIIIVYLIVVLIVGIWSSIKGRGSGVSGYFLAGRKMNWFLIGSSLIGSNIGGEHLVGLAGSGAATGIGVANFEIQAVVPYVLLGWVFVPVYFSSGVYTMPEFIRKRFGGTRIHLYLSGVTFLLYVLIKLAADLFSGAIFIKVTLGWNLYWAILLQLTVACMSTASGGLRAVMCTDTFQVLIMFSGSVVLMLISFNKVGGYLSMAEKFFHAIPNSSVVSSDSLKCAGIPKQDALALVKSIDSMEMPWLGGTLGYYSMEIWYYCADQLIVQKVLSGKNYSHAKGGCILAAFFKLIIMWLMVFPGMIARILYPNEMACSDPEVCRKICYSPNGCSNIAFPILVTRILPVGLKGIMAAAMMSAIMGSLSSIFNSISSIFTFDIWTLIRKRPSNLELLIVGRLFIIFMVAIAVCWIPIIASYPNSQLFIYIASITAYLAPPVSATFLLAILVPWSNEKGAFWSLIVGLVLGLTRLVLEVSYRAPVCYEEDRRPLILTKVHFLHFGLFLFTTVSILNLSISYFTMDQNKKQGSNLTFWTRKSNLRADIATKDAYKDKQKEIQMQKKYSSKLDSFPEEKSINSLKSFMYFLCGLKKEHSADENASQERYSLNETKFWRITTNILGILVVSSLIFVFCFWS